MLGDRTIDELFFQRHQDAVRVKKKSGDVFEKHSDRRFVRYSYLEPLFLLSLLGDRTIDLKFGYLPMTLDWPSLSLRSIFHIALSRSYRRYQTIC